MLVEVGRAPNHQDPDREVNCQRQEDFHRIVSHAVFGHSRVCTYKHAADTQASDPCCCSARDRGELREVARTTAKAVIGSVDLVIRLTQRSFLYLVAVCILDPKLRPLTPPLTRFENGVAEIIGKYFGDVFFALNFDFPSHMRSSLVPRVYVFLSRFLIARVS